ncbi:Basement membrane-specific heparan sulfate proteoglycan core protein, partial [Apaloderma vittatum]
CALLAGVRLPAAAAAGDSGRLGRVRVPGDQRGHHQGNLHHGDNPARWFQCLPPSASSPRPQPSGQTLDLNCVVAGSGPATVTWYKRGGSLPSGHQVGHRAGG